MARQDQGVAVVGCCCGPRTNPAAAQQHHGVALAEQKGLEGTQVGPVRLAWYAARRGRRLRALLLLLRVALPRVLPACARARCGRESRATA